MSHQKGPILLLPGTPQAMSCKRLPTKSDSLITRARQRELSPVPAMEGTIQMRSCLPQAPRFHSSSWSHKSSSWSIQIYPMRSLSKRRQSRKALAGSRTGRVASQAGPKPPTVTVILDKSSYLVAETLPPMLSQTKVRDSKAVLLPNFSCHLTSKEVRKCFKRNRRSQGPSRLKLWNNQGFKESGIDGKLWQSKALEMFRSCKVSRTTNVHQSNS